MTYFNQFWAWNYSRDLFYFILPPVVKIEHVALLWTFLKLVLKGLKKRVLLLYTAAFERYVHLISNHTRLMEFLACSDRNSVHVSQENKINHVSIVSFAINWKLRWAIYQHVLGIKSSNFLSQEIRLGYSWCIYIYIYVNIILYIYMKQRRF